MRNRCLLMSILAVASSAMLATSTFAAEAVATEHEGVSLKPEMLVQIGGFGITNSMLVIWIVAAGIIIFSQIATRRVRAIPSGIQNFWEWLVEGLHNFLENIIGRELVAKGFWFFATIFIFILFVNWFGLIPGIGTIGWGHYDPSGNFRVVRPLLRGGNADLNMTTAMSAIFFVMWFVWAIQANGVGGFLKHLFGPKGETTGIVKVLMVVIFFAVGWLEVISILFQTDRAQLSIVRKHLRGRKHTGSDVHDGSVAVANPADSILFSRSASGICAGARFHAADCGFHNVDCRTPGGTGTRTLIFRRSHDETAKPTNKKYDTTNTSRTERKHSRRACRDGRRNRNRLDRPRNDHRGRSQSRRVHAGARARNSRHRFDRGDRFLRSVSRSLIFTGKAIHVAPET